MEKSNITHRITSILFMPCLFILLATTSSCNSVEPTSLEVDKEEFETLADEIDAIQKSSNQVSKPSGPDLRKNTEEFKQDNDSRILIPNRPANEKKDPVGLPSRNMDSLPVRPPLKAYNLPMDMTKDIENPNDSVEVKFNFDAVSIVEVVEMFSITLNFQYYIDPTASGSVTMTIDTQMTRREAWELFEHILWITGSYASRQNKFIHILPFAKLPQERRLFAKHDPIPNVDVSIVRLFNTAAADIANLIKPFMTAGATASPIQYLNSLLIVEAPPNMPKLRELIDQLDIIGETKWPQISIPCYSIDVEVVLEELRQILPIIGFPVGSGDRGDGHSIKLISLQRMQVILAAAPTVEVLKEVERWVKILDTEDTVEQERIFFYDVKYNKAEDLSESIGVFFNSSGSSTASRSSTRDTGTTTPRSTTDRQQRGRTRQNQQRSQRRRTTDESPTTIFDVPVTILADGNHNRLVIRTTPRAYAMLEALLQRLDTPPLQVLMQVTIAEITLDNDNEHGFQFATQIQEDFDLAVTPGLPSAGSLYRIDFADAGTTEGADPNPLSVGDIFTRIQAFAGKTNTKVLFSPQIIAISDEEATINVGDSVPVATRQDSGTTTDSRILTDVQYQDTGTILTVTPYITAKKLVTLDIRQEVSQAINAAAGAIQSPTIRTRTVETSLVVEDGSTILVGGLISTENNTANIGLPIVKDIPVIGKLFGFSRDNEQRTELLLLMSVHVIDLDTDVDQLLERYQAALLEIEDSLGPEVMENK